MIEEEDCALFYVVCFLTAANQMFGCAAAREQVPLSCRVATQNLIFTMNSWACSRSYNVVHATLHLQEKQNRPDFPLFEVGYFVVLVQAIY